MQLFAFCFIIIIIIYPNFVKKNWGFMEANG